MNTDHPRFTHRLQTLGILLLAAGLTAHSGHYRSLETAGILLTILLLVRLWIELSISGVEPEGVLERKLKQLSFLSQFSMLITVFGLIGFVREQ